jgi:hypothetical protein
MPHGAERSRSEAEPRSVAESWANVVSPSGRRTANKIILMAPTSKTVKKVSPSGKKFKVTKFQVLSRFRGIRHMYKELVAEAALIGCPSIPSMEAYPSITWYTDWLSEDIKNEGRSDLPLTSPITLDVSDSQDQSSDNQICSIPPLLPCSSHCQKKIK